MLIIASASRWVETHMAVGNAGWLQPLQLQAEARIAMQAADHGLSPCPVSGHATGRASMARGYLPGQVASSWLPDYLWRWYQLLRND